MEFITIAGPKAAFYLNPYIVSVCKSPVYLQEILMKQFINEFYQQSDMTYDIYIYILSVLLFLTKNKDQIITNSQMHKITTRQTFDLYIPAANLAIYQKGVYFRESRFTTIYQKLLKIYLVIKINLN